MEEEELVLRKLLGGTEETEPPLPFPLRVNNGNINSAWASYQVKSTKKESVHSSVKELRQGWGRRLQDPCCHLHIHLEWSHLDQDCHSKREAMHDES